MMYASAEEQRLTAYSQGYSADVDKIREENYPLLNGMCISLRSLKDLGPNRLICLSFLQIQLILTMLEQHRMQSL